MIYLLIYLMGVVLVGCIGVIKALTEGELMLENLVIWMGLTLFSWVGLFCLLVIYLISIFVIDGDIVIWKRKQK